MEDIGLIPGLGRFHMPLGNQAHMPQLQSSWAAATEPVLRNKRCHCSEKPEHHDWIGAPTRHK